jgi:periplasmic protein TonB
VSEQVPGPAVVSDNDRLGATLVFSLIAHGVLALGLGFSVENAAPLRPTLDVILTQTRSEKKPDKPDFLAQASQQGGGESESRERPAETVSSPVPKPQPGISPVPVNPAAPPPEPERSQAVVTTRASSTQQAPADDHLPTPDTPLPSSRHLIEQSVEMARLAAEIDRDSRNYAKRPRRKFISANTAEYEFAAYMRAWVARVERIGNLNYPDEARRRNLFGQLLMTVAVRRDGSVERIDIIRSSGYPVLDEAALRIVRLGEPYPPLPETGEKVEILHITRTWEFLPGNVLRNR